MKNSTLLMYFGSIIGTVLAMIIHINLMIETSKGIHMVCFGLWLTISICLVMIFRYKLDNNQD